MPERPDTRETRVSRFAKARYVVPLAALALLVGGISYAAIPGSNGEISGCYRNGSGELRVIDADAGAECRRNETPVSWPSEDRFSRVISQEPSGTTAYAAGEHVVVSEVLPPGFWVVVAKAMISTASDQFSDCFLTYREEAGDVEVDISSQQSDGAGQALTTHNLQGVVAVFASGGATVELTCQAGDGTGPPGQSYIVQGPKITAIEVAQATVNGIPID